LLLVAFVWWVVTLVQRKIDARRNRLKPRGAKRARLGTDNGLVGRVVGGASSIVSAGSGSSCLAYDIALRSKRFRKSPVMLRYGATGAFEVELDDGSRVEIPAGRIRLRGKTSTLRTSESVVRKQLALPEREEFELVPYDSVEEVLLRDGDRVAIHGELEREPLVSKSSAYRHACWIYRPRTVAGIRILGVGREGGEELGDGLADRRALGGGG
ncbi:MAG TPA: hypothetical protein VFB62_25080, partial [Polyangiaceae bacterium]|nr:hypothetical protein [Polyangiaceae bacterium]